MKSNFGLRHKFVEIFDENNKKYYGGNQKWLGKRSKVSNGCGPVAAANLMAYLSKYEYYRKLYDEDDFSIEKFTNFINKMYFLLKPGIFGLISINKFISKIQDYGHSKNIKLRAESLDRFNKNFNYYSCYSFIRNALIRDLPVAAFNLDLRKSFSFGWHWMVITRIFENKNNDLIVVVSSWGRKYELPFKRLYKAMCLGGGLVYFY